MKDQPSPLSIRRFLPAALVLIVIGLGGLYLLLNFTQPSGGTRWAFFFAAVLGLTGLALPVVAYLNRRFPSLPPPTAGVILRQAIWVGIFIPTLLWLRIGRVLTFSLALLLLAGLLLIEWLLRLRERSLWKPDRASGGSTPPAAP